MKKSFGMLFAMLALLSGCADNSLKEDKGIVEQFTDSTMTITVDGEKCTLLTADARNTSALMVGDSVRVSYVGSLTSGEARALLVELIVQPSRVVEVGFDETKELLTADEPAEQAPTASDDTAVDDGSDH